MTGYGREEFTLGDFNVVIEIRSLNGKTFELSNKISPLLKFYEIEIRSKVQRILQRGSVDLSIFFKQHGTSKPVTVNMELARYYFNSITALADELKLEKKDVLSSLMRMPDIVSTSTESLAEEDWKKVSEHLDKACSRLMEQRVQEGTMLTEHISKNIDRIEELASHVLDYEQERIERMRAKLYSSIQEHTQNIVVDNNRLEQEIVFYIEKFDISEEKNRLNHHCKYFKEELHDENANKGKRLGFILQEIGREINTMGSKANDSRIQRIVVQMKDELEQAKEQLLNAL